MKPIVSASVCLAAWLWVFWPVLFGGRIFWYGDLSLYFIPLLHFQRAELLTGHIPLWNPWILCGTPFFGNPQAWPLYPSSGLLSLLSAERAVGVIGALHCLWAMLGTALFLRRRGVGEWGAALGALAFGLGGALVSKCQFPNMAQAGSWLPWLLWSLERAMDAPRPRNVASLGLCIGLAALSAHPQMTWMQALLCLGWIGFRRPNRAIVGRLALATALGGLLAAGQLLPVVGAAMDSVRPRLSLREANRFVLPLFQFPSALVLPNLFGNPVSAPPWMGGGNFWEPCCYAGLIPLAMAGRSLPSLKRGSEIVFWLAVFGIGVWLSFGRSAGLYALAFYGLPGTRVFHDPARFLHLASFALAVLAAYGFERLRTRDAIRLILLAVAAADLAYFSRTLNPTVSQTSFRAAVADLATSLNGANRIYHESEKQVWKRFVNYSRLGAEKEMAGMVATGAPNLPLLVGILDAGGYEPVRRKDYDGFKSKDAAGVTDVLRWSVEKGMARKPAPGAPRATLNGSQLSILRDSADRVELALPEGNRGGELLLRDVLAPGWRATVDGAPVRIQRESGVFRQVSVPAGGRLVRFEYAPTPVRVGLYLSMLGVALLAFFWMAGDNGANVRSLSRR